ncbi:NUMOD4 domain-containing protein [Limosilactobacillus vaginalis]|nr:NUMOD4 domain-containing protein [Limosilactobacillus vaginalis]MDM8222537.1 NUMOD4 domain-containing protein [Limosilactobacillus vaginalis]
MNEIWKDIPKYEGYYQVSTMGRVKSLDRTIVYKNGVKHRYRGQILKLFE